MDVIRVSPANLVATDFGAYQHWSIVSDRFGPDGKPMLISATRRLGTVSEEPWDQVTQGKKTYVIDVEISAPIHEILKRARSQIGLWRYHLTNNNCEHFSKWAAGLHVTSTQVKAGVTGAAVGTLAVAALSEDPKFFKFLGGALLVGGLAVMATKAVEKQTIENDSF